jgi:hypothetical protein
MNDPVHHFAREMQMEMSFLIITRTLGLNVTAAFFILQNQSDGRKSMGIKSFCALCIRKKALRGINFQLYVDMKNCHSVLFLCHSRSNWWSVSRVHNVEHLPEDNDFFGRKIVILTRVRTWKRIIIDYCEKMYDGRLQNNFFWNFRMP